MRHTIITLCAMVLVVGACDDAGGGRDEGDGNTGGKGDDLDDLDDLDTRGYAFELNDAAFSVRRDHAGAPLLATIWGRIDEYSEEAPFIEKAAYNRKTGVAVPWLAHITDRFHTIHKSWAPSFEAMGLDACDDLGLNDDWWRNIGTDFDFGDLEPEQCFGQSMRWPNPDTGKREEYRRTIEVALPDYLTIELGKPAGFPNGRVLHEQINSLMFAMAFLDQGGECVDAAGTAVECDLHTLWRRNDFLKPQNDVPFFGEAEIGQPTTTFPFLAPAHHVE